MLLAAPVLAIEDQFDRGTRIFQQPPPASSRECAGRRARYRNEVLRPYRARFDAALGEFNKTPSGQVQSARCAGSQRGYGYVPPALCEAARAYSDAEERETELYDQCMAAFRSRTPSESQNVGRDPRRAPRQEEAACAIGMRRCQAPDINNPQSGFWARCVREGNRTMWGAPDRSSGCDPFANRGASQDPAYGRQQGPGQADRRLPSGISECMMGSRRCLAPEGGIAGLGFWAECERVPGGTRWNRASRGAPCDPGLAQPNPRAGAGGAGMPERTREPECRLRQHVCVPTDASRRSGMLRFCYLDANGRPYWSPETYGACTP